MVFVYSHLPNLFFFSGADVTKINTWTRVVQTHAVKLMMENGFNWMDEMKAECELYLMRYESERALRLRSPMELLSRTEPSGDRYGIPTTLPLETHEAYKTVLRLLREADMSGNWPMSSQVSLTSIFSSLC